LRPDSNTRPPLFGQLPSGSWPEKSIGSPFSSLPSEPKSNSSFQFFF